MRLWFRVDPVLDFRVRASRSLYYRVLVFKTRREMRTAFRRFRGRSIAESRGERCEAVVCSTRVERAGRLQPSLGVILMHRRAATPGVVSHEMTQAAVYALRRLRADMANLNRDEDPLDERLAWVQGDLVEQFWRRVKRAGWTLQDRIAA